MPATPCPSCRTGRKGPGKYLCPACWSALPAATQTALNRRNRVRAMARLRQLHDQLAADVPLNEIQVTP
jgi:hypothetical protein